MFFTSFFLTINNSFDEIISYEYLGYPYKYLPRGYTQTKKYAKANPPLPN